MRKKRLPKVGERVKVGGRWVTVPGVRPMADSDPVSRATKVGVGEADAPTDELSEELIRMIKAA